LFSQSRAPTAKNIAITVPSEQDGNQASLQTVAQRVVPATAWIDNLAFQISNGTQMLSLDFISEIKCITHGIINELILIIFTLNS